MANRFLSRLIFAAALVSLVFAGVWRIHGERESRSAYLEALKLPSAVQDALALTPDHRIYLQDVGAFEPAQLYEPAWRAGEAGSEMDALRSDELVLLYSRDAELRWDRHDTASLTAMHLQRFSAVPTISWDQLTSSAGPHLLVLFHSGWDWTDQALAERVRTHGLSITSVGPAFGGDAVLIQ